MIAECKKSILRTQREETNSMRLCTFLLVAATLLTAAEISLSQKDGKSELTSV